MQIVVLDRIEDVPEPDYCAHGRCTCIACGTWCWLGVKTYEVVVARKAQPLCRPCTAASMEQSPGAVRVGHVDDKGH
jgi:hypothetical protein